LVGGSAGTAVSVALQIGRDLKPSDVVVVLIPDSGRGYLSKLYDEKWLADFGFLRAIGHTVGDVLARKGGRIPALVHVHPDELVRDAISLLREFSISQVPVVKAELPLAAAEVVGAVHDRGLMERAFHDPTILDRAVSEAMDAPLPAIGIGEPVSLAVERLEASPAILVLDAGHPIGVLTRADVLNFLAQAGPT
jgi:cystathionine beta-synthase